MMMCEAMELTTNSVRYWSEQQDALKFETVWSIWECDNLYTQMFKEKSYRVYYRFIRGDATTEEIMNDTAWVEVSAFTSGGSVVDFWAAAESCYQQAKQQGDWHRFVEDFELTDEGFELTMGS